MRSPSQPIFSQILIYSVYQNVDRLRVLGDFVSYLILLSILCLCFFLFFFLTIFWMKKMWCPPCCSILLYTVRETYFKINNTGKWWELQESQVFSLSEAINYLFITLGWKHQVLNLLPLSFVSQFWDKLKPLKLNQVCSNKQVIE